MPQTSPQKSVLGMSLKEEAFFRALLCHGPSSIGEIAKRSCVERTTAYALVERLQARGFVKKTQEGKKKRFLAEDAGSLQTLVHDALNELTEGISQKREFSGKEEKSKIFFYKGDAGFKATWETLFNSGAKEYCIMTNGEDMLSFVRKEYITGKIIREKLGKSIRSRQIIQVSSYAKEIAKKDIFENRSTKFFPYPKKFPFTKIIFGDSVAFISPNLENTLFVVKNKLLKEAEQSAFDSLWELLPFRK